MKLLHTGDLHLSQTLYGYDRLDDHIHALKQLADIAAREQPDALIIAGDIYDNPQPIAGAVRALTTTLTDINRRSPSTLTILIAGNHDSPSRHETHTPLWQLANVITIGSIHPGDDPQTLAAKHIITIPGKAHIIAIPYTPRPINGALIQSLTSQLPDDDLPVIITAHLAVLPGAGSANSDAPVITIGNIDAIPLSTLGDEYDYAALGHIHLRQDLDSGHRACYPGTPLPISFDQNTDHTINLVTLTTRRALPQVNRIPLTTLRPLLTIPPQPRPWNEALQSLAALDPALDAYIRLSVIDDGTIPPDAAARARQAVAGKKCRFAHILTSQPEKADNTDNAATNLSIQTFVDTDPIDIARLYYNSRGITFSDQTRQMLEDIIKDLS